MRARFCRIASGVSSRYAALNMYRTSSMIAISRAAASIICLSSAAIRSDFIIADFPHQAGDRSTSAGCYKPEQTKIPMPFFGEAFPRAICNRSGGERCAASNPVTAYRWPDEIGRRLAA
jgi:hypothetical protein